MFLIYKKKAFVLDKWILVEILMVSVSLWV